MTTLPLLSLGGTHSISVDLRAALPAVEMRGLLVVPQCFWRIHLVDSSIAF
jgi:hypothetical protein